MSEKPLYQDKQLRIEYNPHYPEEHFLYIKDKEGDEVTYIIQRGILKELATTPRGGIEHKINNFSPEILFQIKEEKIGVDGLHVALCQANIEEEERMKIAIRE